MIRLLLVAALLMPGLTIFAAGARAMDAPAPFCTDAAAPDIDAAFDGLQAALEQPLGVPTDCAHPVLDGAMLVQHLVQGGLVLNTATGDTTYTDWSQFVTLGSDGSLSAASQPSDVVFLALVVDLLPPPAAAPTPSPAPVATLAPTPLPAAPPAAPGVPAPTVAPRAPIFVGDPRMLVVGMPDLPGGARHWTFIGQDTTRLLQFQYSIIYGKLPDNGAPYPFDPILAINIFVTGSIDTASAQWAASYAKPGEGQHPGGPLGPLGEQQFDALGKNSVDVRARQANVIVQAVEWTSGTQPISLDDTAALVRIMATRVANLSR